MHNSIFWQLLSCKFLHFNTSALYFEKYRKYRTFFKNTGIYRIGQKIQEIQEIEDTLRALQFMP